MWRHFTLCITGILPKWYCVKKYLHVMRVCFRTHVALGLKCFAPVKTRRPVAERCAVSVEILSFVALLNKNSVLQRLARGEWPWSWRSLQSPGHRKCIVGCVVCHFLFVVCGNNVSVLHHFWNITTFTAYVTADCDPEKSSSFHKAVEFTGRVARALIDSCVNISQLILYFPRYGS